jgi:enolase
VSEQTITGIRAWEVLDSRGTPTVACEVVLSGGASGSAAVPSGASTGAHEARELRDGGERYGGKGVREAVANVAGSLADAVTGLPAGDQEAVDRALREADGTGDLGRLGANGVLAVSVAAAVAAADAQRLPLYRLLAKGASGPPVLPLPMINIISGGAHAGWSMDVQDFLVVPVGAASFRQALEWAWTVRRAAADIVQESGMVAALVADEGGLGPALRSNRAALEILVSAIERGGLAPLEDVAIAIDVAATQLVEPAGDYRLGLEGRALSAQELVAELVDWTNAYPIVSIEDPLAEDDWDGWAGASERLQHVQLLGDDLFVTDAGRLQRGIDTGVANSVLVKPNQTGTLSSARGVVELARASGYATVLSARSGETEDAWLADLAVAWRTRQIKVGSTMRSERTAKWNRLLRIEAELGDEAMFAGRTALAPLRG